MDDILERSMANAERSYLNRISIIINSLILAVVPVFADSDQYQGSTLIDKYRQALGAQEEALRNLSMEVHMEGRIPN